MSRSFYILNWLALAFFGITALTAGIAQPGNSALAILNILPFALALIAVRSGTAKAATWSALGVNGIWAVCLTSIAIVVALGLGGEAVVIPAVLVFSIPCWLNVRVLWQNLHSNG